MSENTKIKVTNGEQVFTIWSSVADVWLAKNAGFTIVQDKPKKKATKKKAPKKKAVKKNG
jgi:hypothetical protein